MTEKELKHHFQTYTTRRQVIDHYNELEVPLSHEDLRNTAHWTRAPLLA